MANSSKYEEVNVIDPLFTVGSSPPTDQHEELFHAENKGAMGSRVRVQTEKGKEYTILRLTNAFVSAKRSWRRQLNHLQCQVITQQDIPALQRDCEVLEERMRDLFKAQEALEVVAESEDEIGKLDQNLEELARENNAILRQVGERIKDLEAVLVERNSTRSTSTRKSNNSKGSNSSHKSGKTNISLAQRRIGLEEDIATLRATIALSQERQAMEMQSRRMLEEVERRKIEVLKEEERALEEIRKLKGSFKLREELAQKEAMVNAYVKIEKEERASLLAEEPLDLPVEDGRSEQMERFLRNLPELKPPTPPLPLSITSASKLSSLDPSSPAFVPIGVPASINAPAQVTWSCSPIISSKQESADPPKPGNSVQDQLLEIARLLAENQSHSRLPLPEPGIFNGDLLQYPVWIKAFETLIESRAIKPNERLHFLGKYVTGNAKEVVDGFLLLDSEDAYQKAKEMLAKRFGDPYAVAAAYRQKIESWPKIPANDGSGLRRFSDFLVQCEKAMNKIGSLKALNDDQENRKLVSKLPKWAIDRWSRVVHQCKTEKGTFPPFSEFVKFLSREADIACDPVISFQSLKEDDSKRPNDDDGHSKTKFGYRRRTFGSSFFTNKGNKTAGRTCRLCKGRHDLDKCEEFKKRDIPSRKEYASANGLCFGCLEPGHLSRTCTKRKVCEICKRLHPTPFHGDSKRQEGNEGSGGGNSDSGNDSRQLTQGGSTTCFMTGQGKDQISSLIVPVWLSHKEDPSHKLLVYALLDDQSDTTFIANETLCQLGVRGHQTQLLLSTMHGKDAAISSEKVNGLLVQDYKCQVTIALPNTFSAHTIPARREQIPRPEAALNWVHMKKIAGQLMPYRHDVEVGLLIGSNCTRAIVPREVIPGILDEPYALRTDLGWGIVGRVSWCPDYDGDLFGVTNRIIAREVSESGVPPTVQSGNRRCLFTLGTRTKEVLNPFQINEMFEMDFSERLTGTRTLSQEDKTFLKRLEEGIHQRSDDHYEMPLPLRDDMPSLPNNRSLALRRLHKLGERFEANMKYRDDYRTFMNDIIAKGYAEKVPKEEVSDNHGNVWYIPHHGVYHPKKPGKIRVVFDCSADYKRESLNKHLLTGPDLTNGLVGVLCRFRRDPVAFVCDLEAMFHQFKVDKRHRNLLRFLWWPDGDIKAAPVEYRMTVHLFGAASSPGCANFALKRIATDHEDEFGHDAANFVRDNFYVDDGLKSVPTVAEAIKLIESTRKLCAKGGLRLHKFTSNAREVLETIPEDERAKGLKNLDLHQNSPPLERALGVQWCVETDSFQFRITLQDKPLTRRGILSTVSSIYDPLGFLAPFILTGKQILQQLCRDKADWDEPIPDQARAKWQKWRRELLDLEELKIPRCFVPNGFGEPTSIELHHFSDASVDGYGQCSYLRLVNKSNQVHCSLAMGKSRVTPLKNVTVPRLELTAALVSTKVSSVLRQELDYKNVKEVFWTDSQVVLGYIRNDARRFHVFVANRVQQIRDSSSPSQWQYVRTEENPADEASRGVSPRNLVNNSHWLKGPPFLWEQTITYQDEEEATFVLSPDDPELKKTRVLATSGTQSEEMASILKRLEYFSDWNRARKAIAMCLRLQHRSGSTSSEKSSASKTTKVEKSLSAVPAITVDEVRRAEIVILRLLQSEAFEKEMKILRSFAMDGSAANRGLAKQRNSSMKTTSSLYRLDPFLDSHGILRLGGRIKRADVPYDLKHPVILPKKSHVTELIIRHYHHQVEHQGRGITLNSLRSSGYWVIGGTSVVGNLISKCVVCRKLRGPVSEQKMADLPDDRLEPSPPFTYCAVDYFGPWLIKEGRRELKRYGVLFTCLASRAIHLETANALTTDAFINALR